MINETFLKTYKRDYLYHIAQQLNLKGISKLRKPDIIDRII